MAKRKRPCDSWSLIKKFKTFLTCSWLEIVVQFQCGPYDGCVEFVDRPTSDEWREQILKGRWVVYKLTQLDVNTYKAVFLRYESSGPNKPIKVPEPEKVPA